MPSIREASSRHPVAFALLATVALLVLYIVAGIVAEIASVDDVSHQVTEAVARIAAAALVLLVIWRLGQMRSSGVAAWGSGWIWQLAVIVAVYRILVHAYAFFGTFGLAFQWSPLSGAVALNGSAAALLEELVFRGAVLSVLLRCWAKLPRGAIGSALLTAVLFGASHLIRLAVGQPVPVVGLLVIDSSLAGIFYAALVIRGSSIWPAVAIHFLLNAYVGARAAGVAGFEETFSGWVIILLSGLPLAALGLYMLHSGARTAARRAP